MRACLGWEEAAELGVQRGRGTRAVCGRRQRQALEQRKGAGSWELGAQLMEGNRPWNFPKG